MFFGEVDGFVERKVEDDFQIGDFVVCLLVFDGDVGDKIIYMLFENVWVFFFINKEGFLIVKKFCKDFLFFIIFKLIVKDNGFFLCESKVDVQFVLVNYRLEQQYLVRVYVREDKEVGSVVVIVLRYFFGGMLLIIYLWKVNFIVDNFGLVCMMILFDFEVR